MSQSQEGTQEVEPETEETIEEKPMDESESLNPNEEAQEPLEDGDGSTEMKEAKKKPKKKVAIRFYPIEVYDNCSFFLCNLVHPGDFAHYFFSYVADHPDWQHPRFPLRIMPVQVVCRAKLKEIERKVMPLLEETFGGEESIRFSFILHSKRAHADITMQEAEAAIRNCLWSVNPNCIQCLKYQDYGIMVEIIDNLVYIGIAKDFNQLGRYNTSCLLQGRDMKDTMTDSEDEISDDPNLSEDGNVKKKLEIKRKWRQERYAKERAEEAKRAKLAEAENNGDELKEETEAKEEMNGQ